MKTFQAAPIGFFICMQPKSGGAWKVEERLAGWVFDPEVDCGWSSKALIPVGSETGYTYSEAEGELIGAVFIIFHENDFQDNCVQR